MIRVHENISNNRKAGERQGKFREDRLGRRQPTQR